MLTAMKKGFVLTKNANADQDGSRRRIARVSALNQTYLSELLAETSSLALANSATLTVHNSF